jgi:hypothetical protein
VDELHFHFSPPELLKEHCRTGIKPIPHQGSCAR